MKETYDKKKNLALRPRPNTAVVKKEMHNTEAFGDLHVFVSAKFKEPDTDHCSQSFVNPPTVLRIYTQLDPKEVAGSKKFAAVKESNPDNFNCPFVYVSFYSGLGCNFNVCCSFPNEEEKAGPAKAISIASTTKVFKTEVAK